MVRVLFGTLCPVALETRSDGGLFSSASAEPIPFSFAEVTVPQSVATDGTAGTVPPPDRTVCHSNPIRVACPEESAVLPMITGTLRRQPPEVRRVHIRTGCLHMSRYQGQLLCDGDPYWKAPRNSGVPFSEIPAPTPPGGAVTPRCRGSSR